MPEFNIDAVLSNPEHSIAVAYASYTIGEDGEGYEEERGWHCPPENPISMEPDEYDLADGKTAVDLGVAYLREESADEASASHFHQGVWYISIIEVPMDGSVEQRTYHLTGYTEDEELEVFRRITGRGLMRGRLGQPHAIG